ncbi:glycosyltransferase family 2 protein [Nitrospirillum iridis]|uniref:Glycosyltransferase involved in cell wall biosynthesis n=1 Tax=Nitrospirillum iridis TaxID=765888 RepID=A0A7X0AYE0_9PROT|nr:glycosyltransferase family 2 protein [Nitrospirillum iridis]MBB6251606.1 glycosyltransferase involved in cell wall biosynthesis [Nitrospirillum iridis]
MLTPLSAASGSQAHQATTPAGKSLSVVIPMHNEEANLAALFLRLIPVLEDIGLPFEIICVDDGSRDGTFAALAFHQAREPRLKLLRLSRNFGKEAAMSAGLRHASGDAVILMDGDLQHPPEIIITFVEQWRQGMQMVYGVRASRLTDPWMRRFLTKVYYRLLDNMSEVTLPRGAGDFRLLDRSVVDALNAMPERNRFMKGLFSWVGFRQVAVPFEVAQRHAGASTFNFWRLLRFGLDGVASFSNVPLRVWSWLGIALSVPSFFYGVVIITKTIMFGRDTPGYASLMVAVLFLGGLQLIGLGVLGDYLGRVFTEVKGRPMYLVNEKVGFDDAPPADRSSGGGRGGHP